MEKIEIKTLIDITNSGINRYDPKKELEFNQYKNWTTMMQVIGLRCLITYDSSPLEEMLDIKDIGFGKRFKGNHKVWTFIFYPDRSNAYDSNNDPVKLLIEDLHQVPIIEKLTETINISTAVFDLKDNQNKNTIIKHYRDAS